MNIHHPKLSKPRAPLGNKIARLFDYLWIPGLHARIRELERAAREHTCTDKFRSRPTAIMITSDPRFGKNAPAVLCRVQFGETQYPTERGMKPISCWVVADSEFQENTWIAAILGLDTTHNGKAT